MGAITSISITVEVRRNHRVVECRVEHRLVGLVRVADFVAFQLGVPFVVGLLAQDIEVEVVFGEFGLQVVLRAFHVDGGEGNTHDDLFAFLGVEVEPSLDLFAFHPIAFDGVVHIDKGMALEGLGELCIEVEVLLVGPVAGAAETADGVLAFHLQPRLIHKLVVHAFHHVEEQVRVGALREGAAHHPDAVAGGQFHLSIIVVEQDGIIARLGVLVLMLEGRAIARGGVVFLAFVGLHFADDGHEAEVAIVGAARAAEVGGAEAEDGVVGGVIARTAVPVIHAGVGTELHHAERHSRAREGVAVAACADERVDILGGVSDVVGLGLCVASYKEKQH